MSADPHRQLADALRGLLADVHGTELDDDNARALATDVETLRGSVPGSTRRRWYEQADEVDVATRRDGWRRWSLFRGEHQALAPPLRVERAVDDAGPHLIGLATCGRMYEGPPGAVHGGYLAGLFDDLLGATMALVPGASGVTGRLTVRYRQPTPIETLLRFEARPDDVRPRRFVARAVCLVDGVRTAEAEGLFVRRPLVADR